MSHNLSLSSARVSRYFVCLLLLLFAIDIQAQMDADSVASEEPVSKVQDSNEDNFLIKKITFSPAQVKHQRRYNPREKDYLFPLDSAWWKRLYVGAGLGTHSLTDYVATTNGFHMEFFAGYRFSPIHSLRLNASMATYNYANGFSCSTGFGFGVDYQANLTDYILGYSRTRFLDAGVLLGAGVRFPGKASPIKVAPYFRLGGHVELHLSPKMSIFAEPYVGLHRKMDKILGHNNPEGWNPTYGVIGGLQVALEEREDLFVSADTLHNHWYFDIASGITFPGRMGGIMHRAGLSYQAALGMWVNPMVGFRLSAMTQSMNWRSYTDNVLGKYMRRSNGQMLFAGRAELVINAMNFVKNWRNYPFSHRFDFNLLLGGDFGWNVKAKVPGAPVYNGFHCYYYGFTGAMQAMYRISDSGVFLFLEPRYLAAMYSIPYANSDNSLFVTERNVSLNLGTRVYITNPRLSQQTGDEFVRKWWGGVDIGGVKVQHSDSYHPQGHRSFNPLASVSLGYDWRKYATFRATVAYQDIADCVNTGYYGIDKDGKSFSGFCAWNTRMQIVDLRLAYMLNVTNLLQGYDRMRKFNVWLSAGPAVSFAIGQKDSWIEGQDAKLPEGYQDVRVTDNRVGNVSPAITGSMMASYNVAKNVDITAEALGQFNILKRVNPGFNDAVNNLKYGFSLGTRYHINHEVVKHFFKGSLADEWHRGWFLEMSGGWVLPTGTGNMITASGSAMSLASGFWFNNYMGLRLGLNIQQNYWSKIHVPAVKEPVSGIAVRIPYTQYRPELTMGARAEVVLDPLTFITKRRLLEEAPKWDLNVSLGMNFGMLNKTYAMNTTYFGLTTGVMGLYRLSNLAQLFVEPRLDVLNYKTYINSLQANQYYTDKTLTINVGTRVMRPLYEDENVKRSRVASMRSHRGFWAGLSIGASKALEHTRNVTGGIPFSPSGAVTLGYDFTRLHSVRAQVGLESFSRLRLNEPYQVKSSGVNRLYRGTMESNYTQLDTRFMYMLNLANLWTGYDRRTKFNLYLQAGPVFSAMLSEKVKLTDGEVLGGDDFVFMGQRFGGKISLGMAGGAMASLTLNRHWDATAEMLTQCYLNKNYMPQAYPSLVNNMKVHFNIGARYNF